MPASNVRVVGSGFTTFNYNGHAIAWLDQVRDSGLVPLANPEAIYHLDSRHAEEIVTPRVMDIGRLDVSIKELWNAPVWHQLSGLEGTNTILDVFDAIYSAPNEITCQMLIKIPRSTVWRGKTYHNCTVTRVDDSENILITNLSVSRALVINYTHTTPLTVQSGTT